MAKIDLKAYTNRAKQLEMAIFTQKKLMVEHEKIIAEQKPVAPKIEELVAPVRPTLGMYYEAEETNNGIWIYITVGVIGVICGILALASLSMDIKFGLLFFFMCAFGCYIGVACLVGEVKKRKKWAATKEEIAKRYEHDVERYPQLLEEYNKKVSIMEKEYENAMLLYNDRLEDYNSNIQEMHRKHDKALAVLDNALEELYSENVIFAKYRNLVAITTINEYLVSGRCYELEGPDGAYNLYEMELRQNIIISQLSDITSNLEQIRNNQYTLYEELTKSNQQIKDITYELRTLNQTAKLNAYFNYLDACIVPLQKLYRTIL